MKQLQTTANAGQHKLKHPTGVCNHGRRSQTALGVLGSNTEAIFLDWQTRLGVVIVYAEERAAAIFWYLSCHPGRNFINYSAGRMRGGESQFMLSDSDLCHNSRNVILFFVRPLSAALFAFILH